MYPYRKIEELIGKTLVSAEGRVGGDMIVFTDDAGQQYKLYHEQDCCESVEIDDIVGDLQVLVGSPILVAREDANVPSKGYMIQIDFGDGKTEVCRDESYTWTFYNIATINGYVTIKWYGTSGGNYSESVTFGIVGHDVHAKDYWA